MAQPGSQDIDRFRLQFFQSIVEQEERKAREKQRVQKACYHRYDFSTMTPNAVEWICSKCDHVVHRPQRKPNA